MMQHRGGAAILVAMFVGILASVVCVAPAGPKAQSPVSQPAVVARPTSRPAMPQSRPGQGVATPVVPAQVIEPTLISPGDGPAYALEFKGRPGDPVYLTIENEYRDSGGVQPLLSYTTSIKERRFIIQRSLTTSAPAPPASASKVANVEWECDRYEVREKAMKDEVVFDSLRHLYPPPSLYNLGGIPGSKCTFLIDPFGQSSNVSIVPAPMSGEPGRGAPTKTTENCLLTPDNVRRLLDDLGPFFLPRQAVRVGAQWSHKIVDVQRNIGTFTTVVKCTLRSVNEVEGRKIAKLDIAGDISFVSEKLAAPPPPPTTRPGTTAPAASKPREFKLERAACSGQAEFDITRGELVQLSLHREHGVSAEVDGQAMGTMQIKTALAHTMKVTVSHSPTPKPVIVGGKKPPPIPKEDQPRPSLMVKSPGSATTQASVMTTSRPAPPMTRPQSSRAWMEGSKHAITGPPPQKQKSRAPDGEWDPPPRPATTMPNRKPGGGVISPPLPTTRPARR